MAIYGPSMVNSDKGGVEFGALVILIADRVATSLDKVLLLDDAEQPVSADLEVLRLLVESHPREAAPVLTRAQLEDWRDRFLPWLEAHQASLPAKHRRKLVDSARADIDALLAVAAF